MKQTKREIANEPTARRVLTKKNTFSLQPRVTTFPQRSLQRQFKTLASQTKFPSFRARALAVIPFFLPLFQTATDRHRDTYLQRSCVKRRGERAIREKAMKTNVFRVSPTHIHPLVHREIERKRQTERHSQSSGLRIYIVRPGNAAEAAAATAR